MREEYPHQVTSVRAGSEHLRFGCIEAAASFSGTLRSLSLWRQNRDLRVCPPAAREQLGA